MNTVPFDTLKFADRLAAGGITEEQAKTAASALSEAFKDDIATKADIERLETKIDMLESSMIQKLGALEAILTQKIDAVESRITIKMGSMLVVAIGVIGVIVSLLKLIH